MTQTRKITIELPAWVVEEVDARVAAGVYEDAEAFVMESVAVHLTDAAPHEGSNEAWLREQVLPTLERMDHEKTPGVPIDQVLARLKARRAARSAA